MRGVSLLRGGLSAVGAIRGIEDRPAMPELFRGVRRGLEAVSAGALLDEVLAAAPACRALLGIDTRIDHIGFLLPRDAEEAFRGAATQAGFERPSPTFRSTHLARELGTLVGHPEVRTEVAKQTGTLAGHGPVALEAFFPDIGAAVAQAWMAGGVGSHLAIEVAEPASFDRIVRYFPRNGLRMPAFMDGPRRVPAEQATIAYFELDPPSAFPRLEVRIRDSRPQ